MPQKAILQKNIALNVSANNWIEAITEAGNLLVNSGYITEQYIQEMIDAVNELGPYIVVAPGLALAHARPSPCVLKTGISLITLASPINFGSQDNDPVHIVLALCATDNSSHINILTQICAFFDQDSATHFLLNSKSQSEVALAINTFKQED